MRAQLVAALCALAGTSTYAQVPSRPVTLDVVVTVDGARAVPLTPDDFELRLPAGALPVRSVRLVQPAADAPPLSPITSGADERRVAAQADRIVAVYVDEYHLTNDAAFVEAQRRLAAFVRTTLGPRDLVVVLKPLDSVVDIRLGTDRQHAASLIESASARQGEYTPRTSLERDLFAGTPARIENTRRQVVLAGVSALAAHLGQFDGRKSLLILGNTLPARGDGSRGESSRGDAPRGTVDGVVRAANLNAVAVYPIRPTPVTGGPQQPDVLETLARETSGFLLDSATALDGGLSRIVADASRYYLLSIDPQADGSAGTLRQVDVRVRRRGVTVRARGAYALRHADAEPVTPAVRARPEALRVARHASTLIRAWFGQAPVAGGRTRVDFVWEPAPRRAGDRSVVATPARLTLRVTTMDGAEVFAGESSPSSGTAGAEGAGRALVSFESPPAPVLVQMDVLDLAGRVLDRDVRDLAILAFDKPVAFGTAAVYRARTVRDLRLLAQEDSVVVPVATRQFSRAEHLVVRVPVASPASPLVTVRLMNAFGGVLRSVEPTTLRLNGQAVQVEVPLAPLASATYVLEFTAGAAGGSAVERVEFTVTP